MKHLKREPVCLCVSFVWTRMCAYGPCDRDCTTSLQTTVTSVKTQDSTLSISEIDFFGTVVSFCDDKHQEIVFCDRRQAFDCQSVALTSLFNFMDFVWYTKLSQRNKWWGDLKNKRRKEKYFRENSPEYVSTDQWIVVPFPECLSAAHVEAVVHCLQPSSRPEVGTCLCPVGFNWNWFCLLSKEAAVIDSNVAHLPVNPLLRSNGVGRPISLGLAPNNGQVVNLNLWRKPGRNNAQMRAGAAYSLCAIYDNCTI